MTATTIEEVRHLFEGTPGEKVSPVTARGDATNLAQGLTAIEDHEPEVDWKYNPKPDPKPEPTVGEIDSHLPGGGWGYGVTADGRALPAPAYPGREAWVRSGTARESTLAPDGLTR